MTKDSLNGLILAGGRSSRMQADKGLISYHGKPQREHLFELVGPLCNEVFTSCSRTAVIPKKLNPLPDHFEIEGPLNGILSAFFYNSSSSWLSVPVDMPLIDTDLLQFLIHHQDKQKIATCFWDSMGKLPEPLLAIWEPQAYVGLSEYQRSGGVSLRKFLMMSEIHMIHPPNRECLLNINSQAELEAYRKTYMKTD